MKAIKSAGFVAAGVLAITLPAGSPQWIMHRRIGWLGEASSRSHRGLSPRP